MLLSCFICHQVLCKGEHYKLYYVCLSVCAGACLLLGGFMQH